MVKIIRRHPTLYSIIFVAVVILAVLGYQGYAQRQSVKIERLTVGQCQNTIFFYDLINKLLDDSSPRFGTPPGKSVVPGTREAYIHRVHELQRASVPRFKAQGCDITGVVRT